MKTWINIYRSCRKHGDSRWRAAAAATRWWRTVAHAEPYVFVRQGEDYEAARYEWTQWANWECILHYSVCPTPCGAWLPLPWWGGDHVLPHATVTGTDAREVYEYLTALLN